MEQIKFKERDCVRHKDSNNQMAIQWIRNGKACCMYSSGKINPRTVYFDLSELILIRSSTPRVKTIVPIYR